ncbi:hypothetical protein [Ensifer sp. Root278]|uniref:hypothetical protein n=1 Tax=Ensifer sp. Root278 TaxID=1736509 RepID=UPI000AAD0C75|nr:hypothetical protein [Ensifer sp. Root278]
MARRVVRSSIDVAALVEQLAIGSAKVDGWTAAEKAAVDAYLRRERDRLEAQLAIEKRINWQAQTWAELRGRTRL